jgi:GNAT superfamily N-acetyltransferase
MRVMKVDAAARRDADAVAAIFGAARRAAMPWLPRHSDAEDRRYFAEHVIGECDVLVVRREGRPVASLALRNDMVEHLYVRPDVQRAGIGSALLEVAKNRRPSGLRCGSSSATTAHGRSTRDTDSPKSDSPTAPTTRRTTRRPPRVEGTAVPLNHRSLTPLREPRRSLAPRRRQHCDHGQGGGVPVGHEHLPGAVDLDPLQGRRSSKVLVARNRLLKSTFRPCPRVSAARLSSHCPVTQTHCSTATTKSPANAGLFQAADGIRTHDLLHGKQLLRALQGGVFTLWKRLWGESSGERRLRDSPPFAWSFRTQSGLAAATSGRAVPRRRLGFSLPKRTAPGAMIEKWPDLS